MAPRPWRSAASRSSGCTQSTKLRSANALASVKTVAAFGELFNSAYWASRPYRGTESHLARPCEALAEYLLVRGREVRCRQVFLRLDPPGPMARTTVLAPGGNGPSSA